MKKIIIIIVITLLLLSPYTVNANIICNDGTESSSCQDCHIGCCSGHNGCTDSPNNNSYKNNGKKEEKHENNFSKTDFILTLLLLLPWIIAILTSIFDSLKEVIKIKINKIKKRKILKKCKREIKKTVRR